MLLDEATSALDTSTERHIQKSLQQMTVNRTTLIIGKESEYICTDIYVLNVAFYLYITTYIPNLITISIFSTSTLDNRTC